MTENDKKIKDLEFIRENLTKAELWAQLAEEAAELAQAALKMARLYSANNPPRKTADECYMAVVEEHADVSVCFQALLHEDKAERKVLESKKIQRWADVIRACAGANAVQEWQESCKKQYNSYACCEGCGRFTECCRIFGTKECPCEMEADKIKAAIRADAIRRGLPA